MHIRFTLKELLAANQMDSHGVLGDIAKSTNLHRHTIERLYGNRTRTVSLDVLELLCDALLAKNIPAGELPGGLFGRSALWEQIARFAKSVTFYLAERVITESSQNPAALTLSSDDVDVLTTLFTQLSRGRAPAEIRTRKVPFHIENERHTCSDDDIQNAGSMFREIREADDGRTHILIGSQRINLLVECFLADVYKCEPFVASKPRRVPFYLRLHENSGLMVKSCCAGVTVPGPPRGDQRQSSQPAGIWYDSPRGWIHLPPEKEPGVVVVRMRPATGTMEVAIFGFTGKGTRLVGREFLRDPEQFWDSAAASHGDTRVAAHLCAFDLTGGTSEWTMREPIDLAYPAEPSSHRTSARSSR